MTPVALLCTAIALGEVPPQGGTQPGGLDGGTPIADATTCQSCHDRNVSAEQTLYLPWEGWVSSMMGNAARDPLFQAALAVANQDSPGIGTWCLRCHSPQSYVRGHGVPADGSAFDSVDEQGVSCEVCHRSIPGAPDGGFLEGNAQLFFENRNVKHGPYENVVSPAHEGAASPFVGESAMCGQCHQVLNPLVAWRSSDGGVLGPSFPLDTTWEEWRASSFAEPGGKGCVDCHMPRHPGMHAVASLGPERSNPRRHTLAGGNLWGLELIEAAYPELASEFADAFAETKAQTLAMLRAAAELHLEVPSEPITSETFEVRVRVRNLSGHKLPTGYADGRRVWVELSRDDEVVSGAYDLSLAQLVDDPQLVVFEAQHGRLDAGVSEHLALHELIVRDTRIPPAGFRATEATRPTTALFDLPDGGHRNEVELVFVVPASAATERSTIRARLLYQSTTKHYVDFLAHENHSNDAGVRLAELFEKTGRAAPVEMTRSEKDVVNGSYVAPPDAGAGSRDAGAGGAGADPVRPGCGCSVAEPLLSGMLLLLVALRRRSPAQRSIRVS